MKKEIYEEAKRFFSALPEPREVSTCWKDAKNEVPFFADAVVLMDDMFDTVGMASRFLYRMKEQEMVIPLFFLMGGYNPLLRKHNVDLLSGYAQKLGIKGKNLRCYYNAESFEQKLNILKKAVPGKTVVFVTSRLVYKPLKKAVDAADYPFEVRYYVADETFEDALSWINADAAGGGLGLCCKICRIYPEEGLPEELWRYAKPSLWNKIRVKVSTGLHRRRINNDVSQMIRHYQRQLRKQGWAY